MRLRLLLISLLLTGTVLTSMAVTFGTQSALADSCVTNQGKHIGSSPNVNTPIFGIYFCQPPIDDVHIVYLNHLSEDVSNEVFGTTYTDAAQQGCLRFPNVPTLFLVRYRHDSGTTWSVLCYTDPNNYVLVSGVDFGMSVILAACAQAQQIVYGEQDGSCAPPFVKYSAGIETK